jgi:oligopeptide transport system substrate-binding protein
MRRVLSSLLALILLAGLSAFSTALAAEPASKIVFQLDIEPQRMDPTMNDYAYGSYALQNLFRGLCKFSETGEVVPGLAESYDVSEDGLVYTFHLRTGLKWSDGSPLTAADFEYSWKRVLNPELASETAYSMYTVIKNGSEYFLDGTATADDVGIKALDDVTLQVELTAPAPYFPSMTAATAYFPVKKEVIEADPNWEWNDKTYVSNGPFMLKEMRRDEKFTFVKNPYYYNADAVKIDEVEYIFLNAAETARLAFNNGEVDIAVSVNADALAEHANDGKLLFTPRIGFRWYEFRTDHKPFDDPRVRQALAMAINRQVLTQAIIKGPEQPLLGFIPPAFPDIVETDKSWREVHGNTFEEDLEAAKALLAEAGYPNGEGFPTFRLVQETSTTLEAVAEALAQMWTQNLGITAEIITVEGGVFWADPGGTREEGEFEVAYMGYTGDYLDPTSLLYVFRNEHNGNSVTKWDDETYNNLMQTLADGAMGAEREALMEQAEAILTAQMPVIPIYGYIAQALVSDRIGGFVRNYIGHPNFEYCYIQ